MTHVLLRNDRGHGTGSRRTFLPEKHRKAASSHVAPSLFTEAAPGKSNEDVQQWMRGWTSHVIPQHHDSR